MWGRQEEFFHLKTKKRVGDTLDLQVEIGREGQRSQMANQVISLGMRDRLELAMSTTDLLSENKRIRLFCKK